MSSARTIPDRLPPCSQGADGLTPGVMRLLLTIWLLLLVFATPTVALAAPPAPVSGVVTRIVVEGNERIEDATVLATVSLHVGSRLTSSAVRRDLKSIYGTGFFDDVQVELRDAEDGGQVLAFVVDEKPAVRDVRIEGNKKVDEEDIDEVIDIRSFTVLNEAELKRNTDRIRDLYVDKGFFLVGVTPKVVPVGNDQVEVVFVIDENRKVIVQRVDFSGNEHVSSSKIKRFIQTKEGGIAPWLTSKGTFKHQQLDDDIQTIRYVFLEEGFVDAQVDAPKVYLSPDKRYIFVSIHINEGPLYTVKSLDTRGDFVPEEGLTKEAVLDVISGRMVVDVQEEQWREAVGKKQRPAALEQEGIHLDPGEAFKLSTLQSVVQSITDLYADKGYAFANVVPLPYTDPETETVDVVFEIDKGEKMRIGRINITGNDPTLDKVIRRELLVSEGDLYHGTKIRASRVRLMRLGYFDEVNISTPRGIGPNVLDLNISVSEQPTGSLSFGLGYSNLERLVVTGNVSKNNFLGMGYVMSVAVNWSRLRRQFNASFFDPYFLDTRWTLKVDGYNVTQAFQLNEYQRGGSIGVGRYLDRRDDVRVNLEYTIEDVGLTSLDPFKKRMLGGDLYRNGITSSLGLNFSVDKRNNRIQATRGVYFSAAAELAGGFRIDDDRVLSLLGGEFNFVETRANLRVYQPILPNSDRVVFRLNSTVGRVWSTDGRVIPYIHRFRAGGINSVRGYNWFSLGPTIRSLSTQSSLGVAEADDPIRADDKLIVGGTETWINNIEIQADIVPQAGIAAVIFFDAGNAFGDPWGNGHLNVQDLRLSYGAGIRWQSPMGPLRFEYGIPIQPLEGERKSVFDFSIGSFF